MINKLSVLTAIQILIDEYREDTHADNLYCPLCRLFFKEVKGLQTTAECTECPNVTFATNDFNRGCYERNLIAPILNCNTDDDCLFYINSPILADYWKKIYDLIAAIPGNEYQLTSELKEQIMSIAKSYNTFNVTLPK